MSDSENELYLVDGSGFIFRAYFAMAYSNRGGMTDPAGVPVSAVYGFTSMLLKLLRDYHAPYMAVIFDAGRVNFRNDIYADYKANRDETPEDLIPQFPLIRAAVEAFDIPAIEMAGYEADDLIATYTKLARAQGKKVVIVSSDKDLMQLVGDGVRMLDPMKDKWVGREDVVEKFGLGPEHVVDIQALAGDSSDNVPGVPGIGVKTAAALIEEFGSLEALLERAGEIKQNKRRASLIEFAEQARISKRLVQLADNVPVDVALEDFKTHDPDKPALTAFLEKHGFNSILKRLGKVPSTSVIPNEVEGSHGQEGDPSASLRSGRDDFPKIADNQYVLIDTEVELQRWIDEAFAAGVVAIDTETTALTPAKAELVGISMCCTMGRAAYIPVGHKIEQAGMVDLFGAPTAESTETIKQIPKARVIEMIKPLLEDESVLKIAHNAKYDWQMFKREGIEMNPCDDTMMISYVLDGSGHSHGMDNLSKMYLGHAPIQFSNVAGKGKASVTFDYVPLDKALDYAAEDADVTLRLWHVLKPRLAVEKMSRVYEDIDRPLIPVIGRMELAGIKVDPKALHAMSSDFDAKLRVLEKEIHEIAGTEFNIASPKQVGEILFEQMGLEGGKKTKTGDWSTSSDVLDKLAAEGHAIVQKILDARGLAKLKSTYTDALQAQINPETGRVHSSFAIAHTSTGRFSSSDPNLQNIPIRTEEGRKIREAFVAEEGHVLLSVDYSQVELRLAAAIAGIEALKGAFRDGVDIHALTASQVFDVPLADVTPDIRRQAKAVNFGIIYGISGWGLAKQLGVGAAEANEFIQRYLARFPELAEYMQSRKEEARSNGFVRTAYGRKCVMSGINDKNGAVRSFAERQAINAPLQGSAADIVRLAMGRVESALSDNGLSARMLLQVHDELVFEVPLAEAEQTAKIVSEVMEAACQVHGIDLGVPLQADSGQALSWAAAH
jgi:DNA polymerase-1